MNKNTNATALIIDWFKSDREYESGKTLYIRFGRNLSLKTRLNRVGFSKDVFDYLCYELAKLAGMSEAKYKAMLNVPVVSSIATSNEVNDSKGTVLSFDEIVKNIELVNIEDLEWKVVQKLVAALNLKPESRKKKHMIAVLQSAKIKKLNETVPANIKRSVKLREEFPFLKQKDCPGVLKELVSDMLTAYDEYIVGHKRLADGVSQEEIEELTKSVLDNYLENREIWDELNYYKENNRLLGNHPIFEWIKRRSEINAMKEADLVKLRDQLKNKIPRTKKQITDTPEHKETEKRKIRVEHFEMELTEVNTLLGINE